MPPPATNVPAAETFVPTSGQRRAIGISMVVISAALGLLVGELLVRVFSPHQVRTPMFDRVNGLKSNSPNTRGRSYTPHAFDTTITIGPQRFRGSRSYSELPAPGTIRIIAIGDSFTLGEGANDDETYPVELERILRDRDPQFKSHSLEVINAGVGDTGTGEQALYYDEYVSKFHPSIVILGVVGNDPSDDAAAGMFQRDPNGSLVPLPLAKRPGSRLWRISRAIHRFPPVAWLYGHSELVSLAEFELRKLRAGGLRGGSDALTESSYGESNLKLTQDEIAWLAGRVAASGARLVVVYLPAFVSTYELDGHPYEDWRREESDLANAVAGAAMDARVPFLDLRPYMRQVYAQAHQPLYHRGLDEHPNPAGYRAFARGIADFLERHGGVAAILQPRSTPY